MRGISGFPKIRGTVLGVSTARTIAYWGLYWGPLILGNYHVSSVASASCSRRTLPHDHQILVSGFGVRHPAEGDSLIWWRAPNPKPLNH